VRQGHHSTTDLSGFPGLNFAPPVGPGPDGTFNPYNFPPVPVGLLLPPQAAPGLSSPPPSSATSSPATQTVLYNPDAAKGHGGGTTSTVSGSGTTTTTSTSSTGFTINITWDSSVASAPSGFTAAVTAAVQYLESLFSNPVTVSIDVGYGEVMGNALGSNTLGASESYLSSYSYGTLVSALGADATSSADASAVASLPATSPVNGTFWTTNAQAKALGLASGTGLDGYVGFSSSLPFTYGDTNGVASGTYDFNGVALHELTEVMGRMLLTGSTVGATANSYMLYDLFHYAAPGVRDLSASTPGYFSANGGTTALAAFNTVSGGDAGDWASSVTNDSVDAFSNSGVVNSFSSADQTALDVLGWNLASSGIAPSPAPSPSPTPSPSPPVVAPTGVSIAPVTSGLASLGAASGLAANARLTAVAETGGTSGDTFTYTLGGTGAAAFGLSSGNNAAILSAGASGVAGAVNGRAYGLTLTANDTTNGTSSPAKSMEVVVGSAGRDTIQVESLVGTLNAATPTFIDGLGGGDTINGSGMTGTLFIASGVGADHLTGGSGANRYLYGAVTDSTGAAPDLITNFHAGSDAIDLTGLGFALSYGGKIGAKAKLAAHSIEWTSSRGSTSVFVNTSGSAESLSSANMKINLTGNIALGSTNFLHL